MSYVIYGKENCPFCERAKRLLDSKGLEYSYLTLGVDYDREELLEMAPNARTVPQVWQIDRATEHSEEWTYVGGFVELERSFMNEIEAVLNEGHTVQVTFTKADGTERTMLCTKDPEVIAEHVTPTEKKTDRVYTPAEGVVSVFDLEKLGYRSFRLDSVKHYSIVEEV
jgi:glutaredoxin